MKFWNLRFIKYSKGLSSTTLNSKAKNLLFCPFTSNLLNLLFPTLDFDLVGIRIPCSVFENQKEAKKELLIFEQKTNFFEESEFLHWKGILKASGSESTSGFLLFTGDKDLDNLGLKAPRGVTTETLEYDGGSDFLLLLG